MDVLAYNSKVYYVITDGGGAGEQVYRIPSNGNETVLDAIAAIEGIVAVGRAGNDEGIGTATAAQDVVASTPDESICPCST